MSIKEQSPAAFLWFVIGISLFSVPIAGTPILVSDLALALATVGSIGLTWRITVAPPSLIASLCLAVALLSGTFHFYFSTPHFSEIEWILSSTRLLLGVLALLIIPVAVSLLSPRTTGLTLLYVLRAHSVILILVEIVYLFAAWDFAREFSFPSTKQSVSGWDIRRASGLFTEPSNFAVYSALVIFAVLAIERKIGSILINRSDLGLFGLAIVLSTSFTGYIVFGIIAAAWLVTRRRQRPLRVILGSFIVAGTVFAFLLAAQVVEPLETYMRERAVALLAGDDSSTNDRMLGSLELAAVAATKYPILGVGLGQEQTFAARHEHSLNFKTQGDHEGHIGILNAVTTLGIPGGLLYLAMLTSFLFNSRSRLFGLGLILVTLAWGSFLSAVVWGYMAIAVGALLVSQDRVKSVS